MKFLMIFLTSNFDHFCIRTCLDYLLWFGEGFISIRILYQVKNHVIYQVVVKSPWNDKIRCFTLYSIKHHFSFWLLTSYFVYTIYSLVTDIDNAIPSINSRIRDWVAHWPDEILPKLQNWMVDDNANFGYFYLNYEAHEPEKGYNGRMITSGCGSPTERLSLWCEYHLKPLMTLLPYRLEDTSHFIRKVLIYNDKSSTEDIPDNIILCSWDIEAMYPNITNDLGLTACKELLNKRDILEPSTDCIIDAIQITREENITKFGSTVVKQCDGTTMGPHHACSYADAAADYAVDQKIMSHRLNPSYDKILDWSRFRDDIFCIWTGTKEELLVFNNWINNLHPRLKFTMEYSTTSWSIVFLDLRISTSGKLLSTEMYSKSSDTHAYLMPTSCHPTHVCRNIPKGVMKRVKRNCSGDLKCEEGFTEYKEYLGKRGYSNQLIEEAITEAKATPREHLIGLAKKNQDSSSGRQFPHVIRFNPRLPPMSKYIQKHNHILDSPPKPRSYLQNHLYLCHIEWRRIFLVL